jgi:hypothetical protein
MVAERGRPTDVRFLKVKVEGMQQVSKNNAVSDGLRDLTNGEPIL